jgi:hypothetical protein
MDQKRMKSDADRDRRSSDMEPAEGSRESVRGSSNSGERSLGEQFARTRLGQQLERTRLGRQLE